MKSFFMLVVICIVTLSAGSATLVHAGASEIRLRADFTATAAGGPADGQADWRRAGTRTRLSVEVEDVQRNGTGRVLIVRGTTTIFNRAITIVNGFADLNLDTLNGHTVPTVKAGDVVRVKDSSGAVILRGTFRVD